jgi:hypothetical protein
MDKGGLESAATARDSSDHSELHPSMSNDPMDKGGLESAATVRDSSDHS